MTCPKCGSENTPFDPIKSYQEFVLVGWNCQDCGYDWRELCTIEKDEMGTKLIPIEDPR